MLGLTARALILGTPVPNVLRQRLVHVLDELSGAEHSNSLDVPIVLPVDRSLQVMPLVADTEVARATTFIYRELLGA